MTLRRMWINTPSAFDPDHALDGTNVLAEPQAPGRPVVRIWFLSGDVVSREILARSLSRGWLK
jgi:hypothetical protein